MQNWQDEDRDAVEDYFKKIYSGSVTIDNMPWVTGAVGIELQRLVIESKFQQNSRLLEIGCGIGTEAVYMAKQGFEVLALDLNEDILKLAQMNAKINGASVKFKQGNLLELNIETELPNNFDIVIDQGCFHHIPCAKRETYAERVAHVLKQDGLYFMRGFSDLIPPSKTGDGPIRLSARDITDTFSSKFNQERLYRFNNLPVPGKPEIPQVFWAYLGRKK